MNIKHTKTIAAALAVFSIAGLLPTAAMAQGRRNRNDEAKKTQKSKNTWRNIAIGAGALTGYGIWKGNKTLAILGGAGTLYSLSEYEKDRKSQSKADRDRAAFFGQNRYSYNGQRYERQLVNKNGRKYYKFVRR